MAEFRDRFTRADSDALGLSWVENEDPVGIALVIRGNRLALPIRDVFDDTPDGFAEWNAVYGNDQFSELLLAEEWSRVYTHPAGAAVRIQAGSTALNFSAYAWGFAEVPDRLTVLRYSNIDLHTGSPVELASYNVLPKVGDIVGIAVTGSILRLILNGSVVAQVTDATFASGKAGVVGGGGSGGGHLKVFGDWRGGDLVAAPWFLNDSAPVPLAMQFDPAAAPWADQWWGGLATMHFPAVGASVAREIVQPWEALLGTRQTVVQPSESLQGFVQSRAQPWEALLSLAASAAQMWESLRGIAAAAGQPWEALALAASSLAQFWEAAGALASSRAQNWEALLGLTRTAPQPWEAKAALSAQASQNWEALLGMSSEIAQVWEALAGAAASRAEPWEASGPVTATVAQFWEAVGRLAVQASQASETLALLAAVAPQPWESLTPPVFGNAAAEFIQGARAAFEAARAAEFIQGARAAFEAARARAVHAARAAVKAAERASHAIGRRRIH